MDRTQIQRVRRFNRLVTQRVGALQDGYLSRGRPLGEARLIFEIGVDGADASSLRGRLGLDSGYLSRLLHSLDTSAPPKNREEEAAKAKARAAERFGADPL